MLAPKTTRAIGSAWLLFGAAMVILAGVFTVVVGLVALFNSRYYLVGPEGTLVLNLTGWGLLHLVVGALAIAAGVALLTGRTWARIVSVVLVGFNALTHLAFLPAYPVWGVIVIALDVLVIWAIVAHGNEAEAAA
jgi:hypothetical protein